MTIQETVVVTPLRPKTKGRDNTAALRQRRSRAKRKPPVTAPVNQSKCGQVEKPSNIKADVTSTHREIVTAPKRTNYALVAIAYGFFLLGIGINVWNASTGGTITDMALPAVLGMLAEAVVFFLPAWALTLPIGRQALAWALFAFISLFALTNSLRMASVIGAIRRRREPTGRPKAFGRPTTRLMWLGPSGTKPARQDTANPLPVRPVRPRYQAGDETDPSHGEACRAGPPRNRATLPTWWHG